MLNDLLAPHAGISVGAALLTAFLLGLLHGVTPDEHTWPITLSYALGGFSSRRGLQAGVLFSAAFAVQRAIASLLAYLALARLFGSQGFNIAVDLAVGLVMAASGVYILRLGRELHLTEWLERWMHRLLRVVAQDRPDGSLPVEARPVPVRLVLIHGFVAGWGTGAFAIIIYTVLAPAMPNAGMALLPGLLFGLGTMVMQGAAGAAFGAWMHRRNLGERAMSYVAHAVSGNTLFFGGLLFALWGAIQLGLPGVAATLDRGISTGIPVPNLDSVSPGLVVVAAVFVVAAWSFVRSVRHVQREQLAEEVR